MRRILIRERGLKNSPSKYCRQRAIRSTPTWHINTLCHHHRSWIQRLLVWVPPVGFRNYQTGRPLAYATLNVHRHKIGVTDIPFCPPATTNTVFHFIRMHSTYRLQRERLQASFKGKDSPIRFLLTNVEALKPLFEFIHSTKRLQETFKELGDTRIRPKFLFFCPRELGSPIGSALERQGVRSCM